MTFSEMQDTIDAMRDEINKAAFAPENGPGFTLLAKAWKALGEASEDVATAARLIDEDFPKAV